MEIMCTKMAVMGTSVEQGFLRWVGHCLKIRISLNIEKLAFEY